MLRHIAGRRDSLSGAGYMLSEDFAAELGCSIWGYERSRFAGFFPLTILAEMNDSGKTFAEIADYIEANL